MAKDGRQDDGTVRHSCPTFRIVYRRMLMDISLFTKLSLEHPLERSALFVQVTEPDESISEMLCQLEAPPEDKAPSRPENVLIRQERQTFRRLPRSEAVLFTVKTSLQKLTELIGKDLLDLAGEIRSWPAELARYKGRDRWGKCVLDFCDANV